MYYKLWIFLLIIQTFVTSLPLQDRYDLSVIGIDSKPSNTAEIPKYEDTSGSGDQQVISVRITSSVAVGRGKDKVPYRPSVHKYELERNLASATESTTFNTRDQLTNLDPASKQPHFGANIEYIKQLHAKKDSRNNNTELIHPYQLTVHDHAQGSETPTKIDEYDEDVKNLPSARKVPSTSDANQFYEHKDNHDYQHSDMNIPIDLFSHNVPNNPTTHSLMESSETYKRRISIPNDDHLAPSLADQRGDTKDIHDFVSKINNYHLDDSVAEPSIKSVEFAKTTAKVPPPATYIPNSPNRRLIENKSNQRLTTVRFNIVHDAAKTSDSEPSNSYVSTSQIVPNKQNFYDSPKIFSQPAQIYSEPSKFYSEPAKIYSEPAKIYSEPAKVYSEPAKIYSEPSKFYSEPASLHLNENIPKVPPSNPPNYSHWQRHPERSTSTTIKIDEKISILTDGRSHGVQESSTEKCKQDNCKVGYVVEGRQYKKYRVEERTADGFIVGEYGVVRNEDGALRGVRYTADSEASPRLIHDALMKFLQLK